MLRIPYHLAAAVAFAVPGALVAQIYGNGSAGAPAPTVDLTLDTSANGGVFQFTSIAIPAGVTVHLVGSNAAQLLCQGAVTIAGTLEADGKGSQWIANPFTHVEHQDGGPGGFAGGPFAQNGFGPGGGGAGYGLYPEIFGSAAAHATAGTNNGFVPPAPTYGSALPFDLRGGSGGGGPTLGNFGDVGPPASGGGGVIAILAGGPMQVTGTVRARGGDISFDASFFFSRPPGTGGAGSGGSILLGSLQCTRVSGTVDASGGTWMVATIASGNRGGDGFVRIDSYTACGAPDLTGASIHPAPTVALLPFLTALAPARIGQVYPVRCASAPGDVLGFYTSLATAPLQLPPFGTLELAPPIYFLGQFAVPATGADPLAIADIPIPGALALVGATLYSQMFNAFGAVTGQARLSNLLVTTIGS